MRITSSTLVLLVLASGWACSNSSHGSGGHGGSTSAGGSTGGASPSGGSGGSSTGGSSTGGTPASSGGSGGTSPGGSGGTATGGIGSGGARGGASGAGSGGSVADGGTGTSCSLGDASAGLTTYDSGGTTVSCTAAAANTLSVNIDGATNTISNGIFGILLEENYNVIKNGLYVGKTSSIPNTNGLRNDIIQGFKDIHLGGMEWPGGCTGNNYNWQPPDPGTTMGTDDYMSLTSTLGIDPMITGSGLSTNANRNLAWVTYINNNTTHPEWHLKTFKVGNEVWQCGGNQTEAQYEPNYLATYNLLHTPINGKSVNVVAGTNVISNWQPWLKSMLTGSMAGKIDGIELHDYIYHPTDIPCVGFTDNQYYSVLNAANAGQVGAHLDSIVALLDTYDPTNHIKIYEDEWGDWLQGFKGSGGSSSCSGVCFQQITVMDAISTAEQLHLFMQHADRVAMAGLSQAINDIHSLFLTRTSDGALIKTPSFYVFKMFVPHHSCGARWAPNTLSSEKITGNNTSFPVLSAGTTVDSGGRVNVSLANVDLVNPRTIQISLSSTGVTAYKVSAAQIVTGPMKDSYNDFNTAEVVRTQILPATSYAVCGKTVTVSLPPKSVVMLTLAPQ